MEHRLSATRRLDKGEKNRKEGMLPAVLYGAGQNNVDLSLNYNDFFRLYELAGSASLIDLFIENQASGKILIQDAQYDPVTDRLIHVDLRRIDMEKEIKAMVKLNFVGESAAIKSSGGALIKNVEEVEVKCLPKDLVSEIQVDLSALKTFSDVIKVKDLTVSAGMIIVSPGKEDVVAKAIPALSEEQIKAMEQQADVSKVEVAGAKKEKEAEEGAQAVASGGQGEQKEEKKEEKKTVKK